jgi:hypothetical protein
MNFIIKTLALLFVTAFSDGYYEYQTKCYRCSFDYYCPNVCPPGEISDDWKSGSCYVCSSGYYSSYAGSDECKKCPRRDQEPIPCIPGEVSDEGYTTCSRCSLGYYSSISGVSVVLKDMNVQMDIIQLI